MFMSPKEEGCNVSQKNSVNNSNAHSLTSDHVTSNCGGKKRTKFDVLNAWVERKQQKCIHLFISHCLTLFAVAEGRGLDRIPAVLDRRPDHGRVRYRDKSHSHL